MSNDYEENPTLKDFDFKPNIYQSIEDLKCYADKKEPFYDEVKDKSDTSNASTAISLTTTVPTSTMRGKYSLVKLLNLYYTFLTRKQT